MRPVSFHSCFGWLHMPADDAAGGTGVVLCQGFGADGLAGYRSFRRLADALAATGYWSLWQQSVHAAADFLHQHSGVRRVVLCGLRLGATLAAVVSETRADVAGLILLAPVLRGRTWVRQLMLEAKSPMSPPQAGLVLHEFAFSGETVGLINRVDLRQVRPPPTCPVGVFAQAQSPLLAACIAAWRGAGAVVTEAGFAGLEPVLRPTFRNHEESADFSDIVAWMHDFVPPGQPPQRALRLRSRVELVSETASETPLWFGPEETLFGILSRPSGRHVAGAAVVIANSGGNGRGGNGRGGVHFARQLAAHGLASLRIDFAGLGDSVTPDDIASHVFETDRQADISGAIDALEQFGYRHVAVQGICSGAYHAFHAGLSDPRIAALLLVNPPLFQWRAGFPLQYLHRVRQDRSVVLRKLANPQTWRRLMAGQLDLRDRLAEKMILLQHNAAPVTDRLARLWRRDVKEADFAMAAMRSLSQHARTLFLLAEGDPSVGVVADALRTRPAPQGVTVQVVAGLSHALEASSMQRVAAGHMIAFLQRDRRFRLQRQAQIIAAPPTPQRAIPQRATA
jgi:pimeloyl-ACP methyl ester carboxylesterase